MVLSLSRETTITPSSPGVKGPSSEFMRDIAENEDHATDDFETRFQGIEVVYIYVFI